MTDKYFIILNRDPKNEDDFRKIDEFKRLWRDLKVEIECVEDDLK